MKTRSIIIALIIILTPFIIGIVLFMARESGAAHQKIHFVTDTRKNGKGVTYKGIKVDWSFCSNWQYKPLFVPAEEYLVFMFHYTNNNQHDVQLMPSYTLVSPGNRDYSANEEIAMYIEDRLEDKLKVNDETSITYKISPDITKHYIVTFEKPQALDRFYVDVDVFRDTTLRIHYEKKGETWVNYENELIQKYKGRG